MVPLTTFIKRRRVLRILQALSEKPNYAYALSCTLSHEVKRSTLYNLLKELVRQRILVSTQEKQFQAPGRTVYRLTRQGRDFLAQESTRYYTDLNACIEWCKATYTYLHLLQRGKSNRYPIP
jgi:DNA-binding PadR family transcriptional regulator